MIHLGRYAAIGVVLIALFASIGAPVIVLAQTASEQLQGAQRNDRTNAPGPIGDTTIQFTSQRPPSNADEIKFDLTDINVEGSTAFDTAAFTAIYGDDLNSEVTLARIYEISGEIQGLYRDADYLFTRVVVPAQEIDGGQVRIEVIEAKIEGVAIEEPEGEVGPVLALIEDLMSPIIGVTNPTGALLERVLLNVNDIPGVIRATAIPQQGESGGRGALDLFVNVERDPFNGALYADNRQTPGIGRGLVGATAVFNSYSDAGDTTTVSLFNSFAYRNDQVEDNAGNVTFQDGALDFDERNTIQVVHQRNFGSDGLRVKAQGLFSRTRPGDDLNSIGIQGEQIFGSIGLEYPIVLRRQFQLRGALNAEVFESTTDVSNGQLQVSDDSLRVVSAKIEGLSRDEFGYTLFDAEVRKGLDIFGASDAGEALLSRNDGDGDFTLIKGSIERLLIINDDLSFVARAAGQYSLDPLLASEEFAIGGLTFGRGYDPSEFTRDHGFGLSGELRYLYPFSVAEYAVSMELYGFAEYAKAFDRSSGDDENGEVFSGGGGFRFFLPEQTMINAELAFPLSGPLERVSTDGPTEGPNDSRPIEGPRFFVTFSKQF